MLKLWEVQTGRCIHTWEFTTAIKRVQWSADGTKILAVTEERMGYKGAIRVFEINRDGGPREWSVPASERSLASPPPC